MVRGCGVGETEALCADATAARAGTRRVTQSNSTAVSAAVPGEAGKIVGSSAGMRSMTLRRVSIVVP